MIYAIYEDFFPEVEKKLNRVANKCIKHGNDFTFEVKGEEIREKYNKELDRTEYYKFILVEVEGTAKIDSWECIAVLEVHESGNIIRRINTEIEVPERFKTSENICEHCNSNRRRNNLYLIHNIETDEWKQVGGDCLKLYTGGLSMEYVTVYMDGITELEENDGIIGGSGKPYFSVEEVLSYAVEVIGKTGYFNAQSNLPTKHLVKWLVYRPIIEAIKEINKDLENSRMDVRFSKKDFFKEDTEATVSKIVEYYKGLEDDSEFIHNIKVMLNEGYIQGKNIGFLCYLPEGYAKYIQSEVEKAKKIEVEKSDYFGEIGKRYKDKEILSVNQIAAWNNQYGVTHIYKIVLVDGFVLTWKSSNGLYLENGEVFDKITFTVKTHDEYKGQKQTEVTRCKVTVKREEKKNEIHNNNEFMDCLDIFNE